MITKKNMMKAEKKYSTKEYYSNSRGSKKGYSVEYHDYQEEHDESGKKYSTKEYYSNSRGSKKGYSAEYHDDRNYKKGGSRYRGGYKDDGYYYGSGKGYKDDGYYDKKGKSERKRKSESEGKSSDDRSEKEGSVKPEKEGSVKPDSEATERDTKEPDGEKPKPMKDMEKANDETKSDKQE